MTPPTDSPTWQTVTIVGVGLIGASIGLALRKHGLAQRIIGVGRSQGSLRKAKQAGAIDTGTTDLKRGVAETELCIFCTPVGLIAEQAIDAAKFAPAQAIFTDAGSTKQVICAAITTAEDAQGRLPGGAVFVGSHPLAGGEQSGPTAGRADLFVDRKVVVTPFGKRRPEAVAQIEQFWRSLGATIETMTPEEHDRALAAVSHVPHLISALLAGETQTRYLPLAGSGWQDTTRIAAGDVEMWKQITLANRDNIAAALSQFEGAVSALREAIETNNHRKLEKILSDARNKRQTLGN